MENTENSGTEEKKKKFIDITIVSFVGTYAGETILKSIIGWIGLETFKATYRRLRDWWNGKSNSQELPTEEPTKTN